MTLSYILDDAGWASATISHDGQRREMVASYLSDPVAEMADAAICLLQGADSVRFSFLDEPGEHRCYVTRVEGSDVQIRVLWLDDCMPALPDERGTDVFACRCSLARFCGEVLSCLQHLLAEHGIEGYKQRWIDSDFPSERFERLRALIYESHRQKASA